MTQLSYQAKPQSVQDIISRYRDDSLNLEPGFQRDSVWSESDRRKLIDSIARSFPLPAIFLYKRHSDGRIIYDVIDGKQRLESILMFAGVMWGKRFSARLQLEDDEPRREYDWRRLRRLKKQTLITDYNLQVIEVDGDLADVVDLFVRINSTGKAVSSAEKRHAKYYSKSTFLKSAAKLANKLKSKFTSHGILSEGQISRMKHIELVCELMLSIYRAEPINAKAALDEAMSSSELSAKQISAAVNRTKSAIKKTLRILPNMKTTRFRKTSDFYSLVLLISQFETQRLILTDRKRNRQARELLTAFSVGVDKMNEQRKKAESIDAEASIYREYLLTVIQGTDKYNTRLKRQTILRSLLEPIFERMDDKRLFTPEQRRILWNTADSKTCKSCRRNLGWDDFAADHISPYTKGGRTQLANAAIYCRSCNSSKGNRRRSQFFKRRRAA
jgi:hypothetical protein